MFLTPTSNILCDCDKLLIQLKISNRRFLDEPSQRTYTAPQQQSLTTTRTRIRTRCGCLLQKGFGLSRTLPPATGGFFLGVDFVFVVSTWAESAGIVLSLQAFGRGRRPAHQPPEARRGSNSDRAFMSVGQGESFKPIRVVPALPPNANNMYLTPISLRLWRGGVRGGLIGGAGAAL